MTVSEKGESMEYHEFAGKTVDGDSLNDEECRALMEFPVLDYTETGRKSAAWLKSSTGRGKPHELDSQIDLKTYQKRAALDISNARHEEIAAITERARREKSLLNREVVSLKNELRQIENALSRTASAAERVDAEKRLATTSKSLKKQE